MSHREEDLHFIFLTAFRASVFGGSAGASPVLGSVMPYVTFTQGIISSTVQNVTTSSGREVGTPTRCRDHERIAGCNEHSTAMWC